MWQLLTKRGFDLLVAAAVLAATAPLLGILVLLVRTRIGRPAIFRQVRPGLHGRPFTVYKLRSMTDAHGPDGELLPDAARLTPWGRFLRRTSLDELPQLWNVLRGDMSLVGPRPLLMQYLDRYTPEQSRRHDVRPGITGWAQVQGRQELLFSQRLKLDVWYVERWSLALDLRILLLTLLRVFTAQGVKPGQDVAEVDDLGLSRPAHVKDPVSMRKAA